MSAGLQAHDFEGDARCFLCGAKAAGPCAACDRPVCGDCSALTRGGARVYAICRSCEKRGGRSLGPAWRQVAAWVLTPLALLAALVWLLSWFEAAR